MLDMLSFLFQSFFPPGFSTWILYRPIELHAIINYSVYVNKYTPLDLRNANTSNCQKPAFQRVKNEKCENIHIRRSYPKCTLDGNFTPILKIQASWFWQDSGYGEIQKNKATYFRSGPLHSRHSKSRHWVGSCSIPTAFRKSCTSLQ